MVLVRRFRGIARCHSRNRIIVPERQVTAEAAMLAIDPRLHELGISPDLRRAESVPAIQFRASTTTGFGPPLTRPLFLVSRRRARQSMKGTAGFPEKSLLRAPGRHVSERKFPQQ